MARVTPTQFVRQVRQEISRITWPGRRDVITATITVLVMVFIAAVFFYARRLGFEQSSANGVGVW